ncbi:hypothetical protein EF847_03715 [Actinobacteria bacterium YIM 96077]|uniref:Uncharacterized protein n=1 Tax=Phytoactinopolyspora halophila TaxID=1981511 RepID=A0A329R2L8_9ACTN|nr:hypothetical protein [Phytoactinopolyspora halophila]AYY11946.1 hypothetical protein EF847_03715 [Actinobacteria bacterium YIM 96077]RAW18820.1 hypothetical protein DPM12_01795 [Phytoactinopolyspora halophila]
MAKNEVPKEPVEAPEADVYEQRRHATDDGTASAGTSAPDPEEPGVPDLPPYLPSDADPADVFEQSRIVDYDEDDYR